MDAERLPRVLAFAQKYLFVVAAGLVLVLVLARIDNWVYRNEVFAWMQGGVQSGGGHPSLVAFKEAAVENCGPGSGDSLTVCRNYQNAYLSRAVFLHPIHEVFAAGLLASYGERPWLADLHWAAIGALAAGGVLAVALWLLLVLFLPRELRAAAAVLSLLLLLLGYYRDEPSLVLPDPFADGVRAWEAAVLLAVAGAALFGQRLAGRLLPGGFAGLSDWVGAHRKRLLLVLLAALVVNLALPPLGAAGVQVPALAAAVALAWWLAASRDVPPLIVGSLLVLLVVAVSGDSHFLLRKLETSKSQLNLVLGTYIAYLAVRPRGALVYLLPALAVFHVPATALVSLALFLAELPLCLRRLRLSPLLAVSGGSFALWTWFMQMSEVGVGDPSSGAVRHALALVLASPRLWPTAVVLALVAAVSLWPLLRRDEAWDPVARCGLLALQGLGAAFIGLAVLEADPGLELAPGYFQIVKASNLLGPPLAFGIVLGLSLVLVGAAAGRAPPEPDAPAPGRVDWRRVGPVALVVLLLGLAKMDLTPRFLVLDALKNTVVHVALGRYHPDWCRYLAQGAGFDDHYVLSGTDPTNGAENAFSALKLKLRIARGVHDPAAMRISVAEAEEDGCRQ